MQERGEGSMHKGTHSSRGPRRPLSAELTRRLLWVTEPEDGEQEGGLPWRSAEITGN